MNLYVAKELKEIARVLTVMINNWDLIQNTDFNSEYTINQQGVSATTRKGTPYIQIGKDRFYIQSGICLNSGLTDLGMLAHNEYVNPIILQWGEQFGHDVTYKNEMHAPSGKENDVRPYFIDKMHYKRHCDMNINFFTNPKRLHFALFLRNKLNDILSGVAI